MFILFRCVVWWFFLIMRLFGIVIVCWGLSILCFWRWGFFVIGVFLCCVLVYCDCFFLKCCGYFLSDVFLRLGFFCLIDLRWKFCCLLVVICMLIVWVVWILYCFYRSFCFFCWLIRYCCENLVWCIDWWLCCVFLFNVVMI